MAPGLFYLMQRIFTMIDSTMIGKTVSFKTHAQVVLGMDFTRVKVMGILDVDSARYVSDVERLAIAIYPALPKGTPTDFRKYQYIKLKMSNGEYAVVANEWVKQDSVVVQENVSARITIDNINATDVENIGNILRSYNYTNFTTKIL